MLNKNNTDNSNISYVEQKKIYAKVTIDNDYSTWVSIDKEIEIFYHNKQRSSEYKLPFT